MKKAIIPGYGKKGMGWVKNPKKAAYNKVYKKTTFSILDIFKREGIIMKNTEKKPFYQKVWFMALISCFVPVLGIILMWKFKPNWNKIVKVILTIIASFWMLLLMAVCFADGSETSADDTFVPQTTISAEKTTKETPENSDALTNFNEAVPTSTTTTTTSATESTTTTKKATTTEKSTTTTKKATTTTKKPTTTNKPTTTKKTTTVNPDYRVTVYRTKSGECYHYENPCGKGSYYAVSLADAKSSGLRPCEKCVLH